MVPVTSIISAISDEGALSLFKTIALSENYDNRNLLSKLRLTCKQYYSIRKKLVDVGLIKQTNGRYQLTPIGKVVFSAQAKVEIAIEIIGNLKR
jgi:predicted transcriptional regulator